MKTFGHGEGEGGETSFNAWPNPKRQTVQSIEQWVSAFQVFINIYSEKSLQGHLQDTPARMKYGSVIRKFINPGSKFEVL